MKNLKDRYERIKKGNSGLWYVLGEAELEALNIGLFKVSDKENYIAILPQPNSEDDYFAEIYVHYDVDDNHSAFLCPRKMYNERCPICDYADKLKQAGEQKEVYSEFLPTKRYLFFVIDVRDAASKAKGVLLYDAPVSIMLGIVGVSKEPRKGTYRDISDPDRGFNLIFSKRGEKMKTKYEGFQAEDRNKPIPNKYLDTVVSFDEVLVPPDVELMEAGLLTPISDEDETEHRAPRSRVSGRTSVVEDEGEEDNDGEEIDSLSLENLNRDELKAFIRDQGLEIKVMKSWSDDDIRDEIRSAMDSRNDAAKNAAEEESDEEETERTPRRRKEAEPRSRVARPVGSSRTSDTPRKSANANSSARSAPPSRRAAGASDGSVRRSVDAVARGREEVRSTLRRNQRSQAPSNKYAEDDDLPF